MPTSSVSAQRLLQAMAEELKLPLLQIARQAEQAQVIPDNQLLDGIETAANQALWFVDSFVLSQQLLNQASLDLEPVTVSAALQDAAQALRKVATQYNCTLEVQLSGRYGPVMANRQALQAALVGLATTFITANDDGQPKRLILAAHKSRGGVVAGVFSETDGLSQAIYNRGKSLYGRARQPLQAFSVQTASGVFVADSLFTSMQTELRVARHKKLTGLAATLQPSRQLALI